MKRSTLLYILLTASACLSLPSCAFGKISSRYEVAYKPRYASVNNYLRPRDNKKSTLRIVTYNIKFSRKIETALNLLKNHPELKDADILCLQEMDMKDVKTLAETLNYNFVYYPAVRRRRADQDFGNAVLSKFPVWSDKKTALTIEENEEKLPRIAVSAILSVRGKKIMVFSIHKEVILDNDERIRQIEKIFKAVPPFIDHVVVAGDFNTYNTAGRKAIADTFAAAGYSDATHNVEWTFKHWYLFNKKSKLDHIFTKGMARMAAGKVMDRTASDHLPVWAELTFSLNTQNEVQGGME